jgi:predicted nucleotidyltransferase
MPILLVGAAARDLLLVHVHGIDPGRATEDTDVALAIPDWSMFYHVRTVLLESKGFKLDPARQHRLWLNDDRIDLIPFGGVERADRSIAWPPDDAEVMNVSGLAEALATAESVRLPGGLLLDVASLPALAALKVWAWKDRQYIAHGKDAIDLWTLLRHYAEAGNEERLYGSEAEALTTSGFDLEESGAWLLGKDVREVLAHGREPQESLASLHAILRPEIDAEGALRLVGQMPPGDRDRQLALLTAFHAGLAGTDSVVRPK